MVNTLMTIRTTKYYPVRPAAGNIYPGSKVRLRSDMSARDLFCRMNILAQDFVRGSDLTNFSKADFSDAENLTKSGCHVILSHGDADVNTIKATVERSQHCNTTLIGEDTYLLILLQQYFRTEMKSTTSVLMQTHS